MAKFDILTMPSFELSANQAFMMEGDPNRDAVALREHGKDPIGPVICCASVVDAAKVTTWAAAAGSYLRSLKSPGSKRREVMTALCRGTQIDLVWRSHA